MEGDISLRFQWSDPALVEVHQAVGNLMDRFGQDAAQRFYDRLKEELVRACERIAQEIVQTGRPFQATDELAEIYFAQPVYRLIVETAKRRARRSSSGLWYLFYVLHDQAEKGSPDTLLVLSVRHSAAAPFSVESPNSEE